MKEWYSASELTGLPGMPGTIQAINYRAKKYEWESQRRSGRGGGREYHITSLPPETREHLQRKAAVEVTRLKIDSVDLRELENAAKSVDAARLMEKEKGLAAFAALPDGPRKQRIQARKLIIDLLYEWRRHHTGSKVATRLAFCEALNAGDIETPDWVLERLPQRHGRHALTEPTLERWEQSYQTRGIMGLADGYGNRRGQSKIEQNAELLNVVLGCIINYPHITAKKIKQFLEAEHPELNIVSEGAIRRFVNIWKRDNAQLWTYITNPDKWKNVYMAAFGSHFDNITRLNQLWEMDSTPADWMLVDGRHCVIGAIDMYSRRLKFRVSRTSKAEAVCLTFRDAVLDWGVPDGVRTDNGKDYVSQHFDGVLCDLEIIHELCMPFASEQKGTIERAMRTMSHGILDLLPGFIGHSVAERKVIEARKSFADRIMTKGDVIEVELTAEELQQKLDAWCEHVYGKDPHAGLDGRTPFELAAGQPVRRISDPHALDMLLLEVSGTRTVTKKGIRFEHGYYTAPELVGYMQQEVRLRRDPDDIGRVYVYAEDGAFVCVAECDARLGISPAEKAAVAKAMQKAALAEQRAALKEARAAINQNPAEAILAHRIAQSEKVTAFPSPSEHYTTAALDAAAEAAGIRSRTHTPVSDIDADQHAKLVAEFERAEVVEMDDPRHVHAYWLRVHDRISHGEMVSEDERRGWEVYRASDQYRSQHEFFECFGLTAEDFA